MKRFAGRRVALVYRWHLGLVLLPVGAWLGVCMNVSALHTCVIRVRVRVQTNIHICIYTYVPERVLTYQQSMTHPTFWRV